MINQSSRPIFITFEGGEGSGKSTQSKLLYQYLLSLNIDVVMTREIGGTKTSEEIRNLVFNNNLLNLSELLLILAARNEHINKLIIPALNDKKWVICDRFVDSTACYQSNKDIDIKKIYYLNHFLIDNLIMPDITFFLSVNPKIALSRIKKRKFVNNKFDYKDINFHKKIYTNFQKISKIFTQRIIKINADGISKNLLHKKIVQHLIKFY